MTTQASKEAPPLEILYHFNCEGARYIEYLVKLNPVTLVHSLTPLADPPDWTRLPLEQCAHCPLDASENAHCPVALSLAELAERFDTEMSYHRAVVSVFTPERSFSKTTTVQKALSSLLGLLMATSACPSMDFLKPMARFHLPFTTREETLYRAASTYLLGQYFRRLEGQTPDYDLDGLRAAYERVHEINLRMASRLRAVTKQDASVNAVVLLDLFAQELPSAIDDRLKALASLFSVTRPTCF